MKISQDGTSTRLDINEEFTAEQLDTLLRKLALTRAAMTPAVPASREELDTEQNVLVEDKPALSISALQDGGFRLWMRHRGFGWLAYQIDNLTAAGISSYLSTRVRPAVNLVSSEHTQTH